MTNSLLVEQTPEGITTLTFNRPDALNALDMATMQAFLQAVEALRNDVAVRVVIVTGAGTSAFSSGGDLNELSQFPSEGDARGFITTMGDALLALERLPVPVIAAINGYALGGGSEIALACDMRIVDEAVKLGMVQVKMALTPGWGAGQRLLRLVGYARAMEILLHGRAMNATEISALGLANRVTPTGQAYTAALEMAQTICNVPPDVARSIKTLLQAGIQQPYHMALQTERDLFPALWAAQPHLDAVDRFLKRK